MAAQRKEMARHIDVKNAKNNPTGSESTACGPQVTVDTDADLNTCSSANEMHKYTDLLNSLPNSKCFNGKCVYPYGQKYSLSTEDDTDRFNLSNRVPQESATEEPINTSSSSRFQSSSRGNLALCLMSDEILSTRHLSTPVRSVSLERMQTRHEIALNDASCKNSGQQAERATSSGVALTSETVTASQSTANALWKFGSEPNQLVAMQPVKDSTTPSGIDTWKFGSQTNKVIGMQHVKDSTTPSGIETWKFGNQTNKVIGMQRVKDSTTPSGIDTWKFGSLTNKVIGIQSDKESLTLCAIDKPMMLGDTIAKSTLLKSAVSTDDATLIINDKNWSLSLSKAANDSIGTLNDDCETKGSRSPVVEVGTAIPQTLDSEICNLSSQDHFLRLSSGAVVKAACYSRPLEMQEAAPLSNLVDTVETIRAAPNSLESANSQMRAITQLPLAPNYVTMEQSQRRNLTDTSSASKIVWGVSEETCFSSKSKRSNSAHDDGKSIFATLSLMKRGCGRQNMHSRSRTTGPTFSSNRQGIAKEISYSSHRDSINALARHSTKRKQQPSNFLSDKNSENYHRDNSPTPEAVRSSNPLPFGPKTSSEALNQKSKSGSKESDSHSELSLTPNARKSRKDNKGSKPSIPECHGKPQSLKGCRGLDPAKKSSKSTAHVVKPYQNEPKRYSSPYTKHANQHLTARESFDLKPSKLSCPIPDSSRVRSTTGDTLERPRSREKMSEIFKLVQQDSSKPVELIEVSDDETSYCRDFTSGSTNTKLITHKKSNRTSKSLPREPSSNFLKPQNSIPQDVSPKSINIRKPNGPSTKSGHDVIKPAVHRRRSSSRKKSTDAFIRDVTSNSASQELQHSEDARDSKLNAEGFAPSMQMLQALQTSSLQMQLNLHHPGNSETPLKLLRELRIPHQGVSGGTRHSLCQT